MRNKLLAVAAASVMVAGGAIGAADAAGTHYFKTTIAPYSGVKPGTVMKVKGHGATPSTPYLCLQVVYNTHGGGISAPNKSTIKPVTSSSTGAIKCTQTYKPFTGPDNKGVTRHCPTTRADRAAGFQCGVALADAGTLGALSASAVSFFPKK